jgi:alpha,alpha-trehalose phosphorylase
LVETARLWTSLGFHSADDGAFHIHGVTGPDEYTARVDDNTYTNLLAQANLAYSANVVDDLCASDHDWYHAFRERLQLGESELNGWLDAAGQMFIPFDERRGMHPQDAHFLENEVWDVAATPADHFPLLLHYHPLVIYRFQVLKQADVVLAMLLYPESFTADQKRANFAYYEPITTGDSSLSHAVQSVIASEVGEDRLAFEHFEHALFMDLANWAGNVEDGVHIAAAGGVWLALVYGFAGLQVQDKQVRFNPHLPPGWERLTFSIGIRSSTLEVTVRPRSLTLYLLGPDSLHGQVQNEPFYLAPGSTLTLPFHDSPDHPD